MTDFYYSLPLWIAAVLVLGLALIVGLGSSIGVRALFRLTPSDEEKEVAFNLMHVVAAYIGIMLAFSGVAVWQNFADAESAVHHEAASAAEVYRDLTVYGPETEATRVQLRAYVATVLKDEWPLLKEGRGSMATETALAKLFGEMGKIRPQDQRDAAIYTEALSKLNELVVLRRDRIIASRSGIPIILWVVGLVGSSLAMAYASAFSRTRFNLVMISGTSLAIGLVFLFILTVDGPFKGQVGVDRSELVDLSATFDRLDKFVP
ncbi:MAG: hypothetical protein ABIR25_04950 [Sphingomicrobium sp.]